MELGKFIQSGSKNGGPTRYRLRFFARPVTIGRVNARHIALAIPLVLLGIGIGVLLPSRNREASDSPEAADPAETARLHALFERDWEAQLERDPTWASQLGDRRWNDRWPDLSAAAFEAAHTADRAALEELSSIDRSKLSTADQLNYDLFKHGKEIDIEQFGFGWHRIALTQRGGIQTEDELADALRFETEKDFTDWIARLRALPAYIDQTRALLQAGIDSGVMLPRVIMQRVPAQIDKQIVDDPEESPFFKPFVEMPDGLAPDRRDQLLGDARAAIAEGVVPAYREFARFFRDDYLLACPEEVGARALQDGEALYAFMARKFTTPGMTPDEIHEIGLAEVARIRAEMETVKESTGFEGTLPEFFEFLRTDPRFYYQSGPELLAGYAALSRRIDPLMVKVFKRLPRTPYGITAIPDKIAPDTTTAYYRRPAADGTRPGEYFVNLYRPETRPKWEMMALSLHEAVPGHHLQLALAMELGELPEFRRNGGYTAFIEGWGLYSEYLGEELGLYDDPYDKFGQLTYEMWRAVRLVVDTGMHHKGWTRDQAIEFFMDNAPKSELDITNEIDRYIAWPGQALAYKIGELKLKELRARAEEKFGEEFDVREFHDVVLRNGAVPLDVLERFVEDWLEQ